MSALDTIITDISKAARLIEPMLAVLQVAQKATGAGGIAAVEALAVIDAALQAFAKAADGTMTSDEVITELKKLQDGIAGNDAAADAALAERFPAP